ncbi:PIN domain-containing protein [Methylocystis sp. SC2]|uniref:type II toxin-antitoxin system VapC family toxin n=1 Tax=Methylocystis sp. (strain SC2) TaxID=187303 RepID=UPI00027AE836|nr:PIN domain-containing protein [Methylocystis sp. SC2]CCJ06125.1 Putative PilT-like protein [Methylocystis sp. SC2]
MTAEPFKRMPYETLPVEGGRAYFDSNSVIYFIEANPAFYSKISSLWYALIEQNTSFVTSEFCVAECFYGAFRRQSQVLENGYDRLFFEERSFDIRPVDLETLIGAARLGADLGLRLIDAVHFRTALTAQCDIFVTNDRRFRSGHGLRVVQIAEL